MVTSQKERNVLKQDVKLQTNNKQTHFWRFSEADETTSTTVSLHCRFRNIHLLKKKIRTKQLNVIILNFTIEQSFSGRTEYMLTKFFIW